MSDSALQPSSESASSLPVNHDPSDASEHDAAERTRQRLRLLPPEVGAVLVTVGVAGLILPGPFGTPFLLAGGLILAPRYFHRMELWAQKRFPDMHRVGRRHVDRFIDDFEKRYPRHPHREPGDVSGSGDLTNHRS